MDSGKGMREMLKISRGAEKLEAFCNLRGWNKKRNDSHRTSVEVKLEGKTDQ